MPGYLQYCLKKVRGKFTATVLVLALLGSFISCYPVTSAKPAKKPLTFSGKVRKGERFAYKISDDLEFSLEPIKYGWLIEIQGKANPENDLARLTIPYHFVPNPREIEGWHFRNSDNTGPNTVGLKNVNAPQKTREFIFSKKVGKSINYPPTTEELKIVEKDGHGFLEITSLKLTNLRPRTKAGIQAMSFKVSLTGKDLP